MPLLLAMRHLCATCFLGLFLLGCASSGTKPVDYLDQATGHAREDDVRKQFGPPLMQVPGEDGATIWIYRYAGVSAAGPALVEQLWCYEHALTFGRNKVLQKWNRQRCHQ
jgi:hypothetical protein